MTQTTIQPLLDLITRLTKQLLPPVHEGKFEIYLRDTRGLRSQLALERLPSAMKSSHAFARDVFARMSALEGEAYHKDESADIVTLILSDEVVDPIRQSVEGFLEASRRAQNGLIPYLRKLSRRPLPDSLHELVKEVRNNKHSLAGPAQKILLEYWNEHGWRVKWLRDQSQHHAIVTSELVLWKPKAKPNWAVSFLLPDFPSSEGLQTTSYTWTENHTQIFVANEFLRLVEFATRCLQAVQAELGPTETEGTRTHIKNPHFMGALCVGHAVLPADSLETKLKEVIRGLGLNE